MNDKFINIIKYITNNVDPKFISFEDSIEKDIDKIVAKFIALMDKNSKSVENYYSEKSSVFSGKFIKSLEEAQFLLMELETIKEKSTSKEKSKLKKNGTFHKSNIDLSMLLQDTKELENKYKKLLKKLKIDDKIYNSEIIEFKDYNYYRVPLF